MITNLKINGTNYPIMKGIYGLCTRGSKGSAGGTFDATYQNYTISSTTYNVYYRYNSKTFRLYGNSSYGVRVVGGPYNGRVVVTFTYNGDTYTYRFMCDASGGSPYIKQGYSKIQSVYSSLSITVYDPGTTGLYYIDLLSSDQSTNVKIPSLETLHTAFPVYFYDGVNTCHAADTTADYRKRTPDFQIRYVKTDGTTGYQDCYANAFALAKDTNYYVVIDNDSNGEGYAFIVGSENYVDVMAPASVVEQTVKNLDTAGYYPPYLVSTHIIAATTSKTNPGIAVGDYTKTCNLSTNYTFDTSKVQYYPLSIIGGRSRKNQSCLDDLYISSRSYNTCTVGCHVTNHSGTDVAAVSDGNASITCQVLWQREIK